MENELIRSLSFCYSQYTFKNFIWTFTLEESVALQKNYRASTPLGIEPRISGFVDQRLIHWAMESFVVEGLHGKYLKLLFV